MARSRGKIPLMPQPKGSTPWHEGIYLKQTPERKGSDEDHLFSPFASSAKIYTSNRHQASYFHCLKKLLFYLVLQLALQIPALSTQKQEKGWDIFWLMLPFTCITLKPKDDLWMRFNIDSPVQLLTLFTCLLFMEVDFSCPQPSNCLVMWALNWWWLQVCTKFQMLFID